MQQAIIKSFHDERDRAKMPGYVCTYDDYDGGDFDYDSPSYAGAVAGHERGRSGRTAGTASSRPGTHLGQPDRAAAGAEDGRWVRGGAVRENDRTS